jgi:hypothetical protein
MTVIDCHAYLGKGKSWYGPEREVDYTLGALFEHGAEAGIDQHCVAPARNETYAQANKRVASLCEKHEGKLIGFAAHSPQREAGSLARALTDEVKSMGLRGVRSDGHPTRELLDAALELRIPVLYYPSGDGWQELGRFTICRRWPTRKWTSLFRMSASIAPGIGRHISRRLISPSGIAISISTYRESAVSSTWRWRRENFRRRRFCSGPVRRRWTRAWRRKR